MQGASVLDPFSFIGNEVEFGFGRNSRLMVDEYLVAILGSGDFEID